MELKETSLKNANNKYKDITYYVEAYKDLYNDINHWTEDNIKKFNRLDFIGKLAYLLTYKEPDQIFNSISTDKTYIHIDSTDSIVLISKEFIAAFFHKTSVLPWRTDIYFYGHGLRVTSVIYKIPEIHCEEIMKNIQISKEDLRMHSVTLEDPTIVAKFEITLKGLKDDGHQNKITSTFKLG